MKEDSISIIEYSLELETCYQHWKEGERGREGRDGRERDRREGGRMGGRERGNHCEVCVRERLTCVLHHLTYSVANLAWQLCSLNGNKKL